jgi:hypothetical protein
MRKISFWSDEFANDESFTIFQKQFKKSNLAKIWVFIVKYVFTPKF